MAWPDERRQTAGETAENVNGRLSRWWILIGAVLIAGLTLLVYLPSMRGGFILDDDLLLTDNALIKAPDGWYRVWFTTDQADYVPLTSATLWLEWRLWGMDSTGYRGTNLLLHLAACLLIWKILSALEIPGGFFAALLYAIHPVNVESVAWVEQRKDTLSLVWFLLSILWYLRGEGLGARDVGRGSAVSQGWYWASLLAFLLAMFSKGSAAVLPLVLLLIVWWRRGELTKRDLLRSVPFFAIAAVMTPVIIWFVGHGAEGSVRSAGFVERLAGAGAVIWFYLAKALLPIQLVFIYPLWKIQTADWMWWLPLLGATSATAALWWNRKRWWGLPLLFAWGFFCIALLPVLGFTDPGFMKFSLVADHYQHLALIGVVAIVAAGFSFLSTRGSSAASTAVVLQIALVAALAALAWQQSRLYESPITLYEATLAKNQTCWPIYSNYGSLLIDMGRPADGIEKLRSALQYQPTLASAFYNIGRGEAQLGNLDEAVRNNQAALRLQPDYAEAYNNLGNACSAAGRAQEAIDYYLQSLKFKPNFSTAHYNLALVLANTQQLPEAIAHYREALRLDPGYVVAYVNLGNALFKLNQPQEAIQQYEWALQHNPNDSNAHLDLGIALGSLGRWPEAIDHYQQSLRLKADNFDALANLALAYAATDRSDEAIRAAQEAASLARAQNQTAMAEQIENWLTKYRAGHAAPENSGK